MTRPALQHALPFTKYDHRSQFAGQWSEILFPCASPGKYSRCTSVPVPQRHLTEKSFGQELAGSPSCRTSTANTQVPCFCVQALATASEALPALTWLRAGAGTWTPLQFKP